MNRVNTFPGFSSGRQIGDILSRSNSVGLCSFTQTLFKQISEANQNGRLERYVERDKVFFDSMAHLLMGDESCAAIAISGNKILIATNKGQQDKRAIYWDLRATVLEKYSFGGALRVGYICRVRAAGTGEELEKRIGPVQYQFFPNQNKAIIVDQNQNLEFVFSEKEFKYVPDDKVTVRLKLRELEGSFFRSLLSHNENDQIKLTMPVVTCLGALKRRTARLLDLLASISTVILKLRPWLPENCPPQYQSFSSYIERKYHEHNPEKDEESFIQDICLEYTKFPKDRTIRKKFLDSARLHYQARKLKDDTFTYLEKHKEWIKILNDSLTYELAQGAFKDHVSIGSKEMEDVYEKLVDNYKEYKEKHSLKSSVQSVISWHNAIKSEQEPPFELPDYLFQKYPFFLNAIRHYFIQLAFVEEYITKNAKNNGALARRLAKENIFKEPEVEILEGEEGVHAEMRLFSHHLLERRNSVGYYGIAKLCCALCNYTLKQFQLTGLRCPETRGTHATTYRWTLPEAFSHDVHMKHFLGQELFEKYKGLPETVTLPLPKKGSVYMTHEVCKNIISWVDGLNSRRNLDKIGLDRRYLIKGTKELHYPDNSRPPNLPLDHKACSYEKTLECAQKAADPELFICYQQLGFAWREKNKNNYSYYYLLKARDLFEQFPGKIDPKDAGAVLHVLGRVCRDLKLDDEAQKYFLEASEIKEHTDLGKTFNSLGILHFNLKEFDKAHFYFTKALKAAKISEHKESFQRNLDRLEKVYTQ